MIDSLVRCVGLIGPDEFVDPEAALQATIARAPVPPSAEVVRELREELSDGWSCLTACGDCDPPDALRDWLATIPSSWEARDRAGKCWTCGGKRASSRVVCSSCKDNYQ